MYGYPCAHCEGTVREKVVKREGFRHRLGFVILEDVPVGICDACGVRYYDANILHRVQDVATGKSPTSRTEVVPAAGAV